MNSDICFIGLKCFDLLIGKNVPRYIGGIEKQLVSLANALSREGVNCSFITYDHGQPEVLKERNITVLKSYRPEVGLPIIRFFYPRFYKLLKTMKIANAKIYIQMGAGSETGFTALASRLLRKKFLFFTASDGDCDNNLSILSSKKEIFFYKIGLKLANRVIVQSVNQQRFLKRNFSVDSVVISLPCSWSISNEEFNILYKQFDEREGILWVGRIDKVKRPNLLIKLAEKCPELPFYVVGSANKFSSYSQKVLEQMQKTKNIIVYGKVSDEKLKEFYLKSKCLCCTSSVEGFPTIFMEAWNYGLPVISTFDPDGLMRKNRLGCVVENLHDFKNELYRVYFDKKFWKQLSQNSRRFFEKNYLSSSNLVSQLIDFLSS